MNAARRSLALLLLTVSALDATATYAILRAHAGQELNPVARAAISVFGLGAPAAARVVLGLAIGACALRLTVVAEGRAQQVCAWGFAVVVLGWWAFIAVQNLRYV